MTRKEKDKAPTKEILESLVPGSSDLLAKLRTSLENAGSKKEGAQIRQTAWLELRSLTDNEDLRKLLRKAFGREISRVPRRRTMMQPSRA